MAQTRETDSLLPQNNSNTINLNDYSISTKLLHRLNTPVSPHHTDLILLYCYIITGLLDSSAVFIWGSFVSMQTGNTVYLGLGLASPKTFQNGESSTVAAATAATEAKSGRMGDDDDRYIKSGISIASFCLGSLMFAAFHRAFSPRRRWVLMVSFVVQMGCIVCAAGVVMFGRSPSKKQMMIMDTGDEGDKAELSWRVILPLALVAFQSSGQAVTSRVLKLGGLSSVVLTSIYCDLFSFPGLFTDGAAVKDVEERRRLGAVVCLLFGAIMGGIWARSEIGLMGALWMAVVMKGFIVLAWFLWKEEERDEEVRA